MRRVVSLLLGIVTLVSLLAACASPTPQVIERTVEVEKEVEVERTVEVEVEKTVEVLITPTPAPVAFNEAPMLAEKVANGDLPPVDERLPLEPRVVDPPGEIGTYGGTLKMLDQQTRLSLPHRVTDRGLFVYNIGTSAYFADVASGWEWNDDYSALTIYLRKGLKWSDGDDLTTEDFQWYWDNVLNNEVLRPNGPGWPWVLNDVPATLNVHDDYSLTYTWPTAFPAIMDQWGRSSFSSPGQWFWGPSHWHQQFHGDFVDDVDALNAEAEANGFAATETAPAWVAYFNSKGGQYYSGIQWGDNLDMPVVRPWHPVEVTQEYILMERNPYFYMVDTAGNQLPYFDYLRVDVAGDVELYNLKLTAGEADVALWFPSFANMELYKANELSGNYQTLLAKSVAGVEGSLTFNVSYVEDMVVGDLMRNLDFRRAISLGMNRDKWNDVLCFGLCEPHPAAPLKSMPWWSDSFIDEYYAFDPDRANQMLDDLGLDQRDSEGYRLMEDGRRLILTLTSAYAATNSWAELFTQDMRDIGIEIIYNLLEPVAQEAALTSNQVHLSAGGVGRITLFGRGTPDNWALHLSDRSRHFWGPGYLQWMASDGEEGVEPPEELMEQMAKWEVFSQLPADSPEAAEFGKAYFQWFIDNMYLIGGHGLGQQPFIIHNTIGGFPKDADLYFGSDNNFYQPYNPELWYRK